MGNIACQKKLARQPRGEKQQTMGSPMATKRVTDRIDRLSVMTHSQPNRHRARMGRYSLTPWIVFRSPKRLRCILIAR